MKRRRREPRSFGTLAKKQRALQAIARRLGAQERKLMARISRVLEMVGYRVVAAGGRRGAGPAPPRRPRARKDLKCPKCDRRFAFEMHRARHVNATHGSPARGTRKTAVRKKRGTARA
jgi:uncharacterized C2H2 Zn-finger protein